MVCLLFYIFLLFFNSDTKKNFQNRWNLMWSMDANLFYSLIISLHIVHCVYLCDLCIFIVQCALLLCLCLLSLFVFFNDFTFSPKTRLSNACIQFQSIVPTKIAMITMINSVKFVVDSSNWKGSFKYAFTQSYFSFTICFSWNFKWYHNTLSAPLKIRNYFCLLWMLFLFSFDCDEYPEILFLHQLSLTHRERKKTHFIYE